MIVSDFQKAVLRQLLASGHPWMKLAEEMADYPGTPYGGKCHWKTLVYWATDVDDYARSAVASMLSEFPATPPSRNDSRENLLHWSLHYFWLKAYASEAQRGELRARLRAWCDAALAGTRPEDTDELVGHYFGVTAAERATRDDPGGSVVTLGSTVVNWTAAVRELLIKYGDGTWCEGTEYNLGTLQLLALGERATAGTWPEAAALLANAAVGFQRVLTPDFKSIVKWGDVEHPSRSELELTNLVPLLCLLNTYAPGGECRHLLARLVDMTARPYPAFWFRLYRALWVFDPRTVSGSQLPTPTGVKHAPGVGLTTDRSLDRTIVFHGANRLRVDHDVPYVGDVRVYQGGEWVVDHPLGYAAEAAANNTVLFSGLPAMQDRTSGVWSAGTGGTYVYPGYWDPPPDFLVSHLRTVTPTAAGVDVVDLFDGRDPLLLPKLDRYAPMGGDTVDRMRNRLGLWEVIWHCQTQPTASGSGTFTWTTPKGRQVTLTAFGHDRYVILKTKDRPPYGVNDPDELAGWQVRLISDQPKIVMTSSIVVAGVPTVPPPPPPVVPPPPPPPPPAPVGQDYTLVLELAGGQVVRLPVRLEPR